LLFNQIQNVSERTFLLQALHEEVKGQCWSQTELAAFYNSPLPDLIVQITASALRKVDALPIADRLLPDLPLSMMMRRSFSGVLDEQGTL
jgi:hypothetical protein